MALHILKKFKSLSVLARTSTCFGVAAIGCLIVNGAVSTPVHSQQPQQTSQGSSQVEHLFEYTSDTAQPRQEDGKVRSPNSVHQLLGAPEPNQAPIADEVRARVITPRTAAIPAQSTWKFPEGESELLQRASFNAPTQQGFGSSSVHRPVYQENDAGSRFNQTQSANNIKTDPNAFTAPATTKLQARPTTLPTTRPGPTKVYVLKNQTWKGFESKLASTWGPSLKAHTTQEGRMLHIEIPTSTGQMPMTLDRMNNSIKFAGAASQATHWMQTVQNLDQAPSEVRTLVSVPAKMKGQVKQTVFAMKARQDNQLPPLPTEEDSPIARALAQDPDLQELMGNVTITVTEEGNVLISGDPETVKRVRKIIDDLVAEAEKSTPGQERVDLENAVSST